MKSTLKDRIVSSAVRSARCVITGGERGREMRHRSLLFREAWAWERPIEQFVQSRIEGKSLNVCSGSSLIGDVKIDVSPRKQWFFENNGMVKADMMELPFANESFDTVICDPPWKMDFFKRPSQFFELIRVCKTGGNIIYNATWIPESNAVKLKEIWIRKSARFGTVSALCVFRKVTRRLDS